MLLDNSLEGGHPEDRTVAPAPEELEFFSHEVKILGACPAHPYRLHGEAADDPSPTP